MKCLLGVANLQLFSLYSFPSLSYLGSPPFGGVGGGFFTTSYAASSAHTLTVLPCVHQVSLLQQYICLLHQNNS